MNGFEQVVQQVRTNTKHLQDPNKRTRRFMRAFGVSMNEYRFLTQLQCEPSGCIVWKGPLTKKGYGTTWRGQAHRVAWQLLNGPIPQGSQIHHRCHNGACCEVDHLELLTAQEHQEKHKKAKLSQEKADAIRALMRSGRGRRTVAAQFGVTPSVISNVVHERLYPSNPREGKCDPPTPDNQESTSYVSDHQNPKIPLGKKRMRCDR